MGIFNKRSEALMKHCMDCAAYARYAEEATTISDFVQRWNDFDFAAESLSKDPLVEKCSGYEEVYFKQIMELHQSRFKYQGAMRRALERQGIISRKAMQGKYLKHLI